MQRPARVHYGLSLLAGALLAAAQAPVSIWPAQLAGFALALHLFTRTQAPRRAAWTGWCVAAAYFALSLSWIIEPFLVDIARHGWMAPFALALMAGGLGLFWAAAFWGAAKLGRPWALVALWPLAEYARANLFTGFPWGLSAYGWIDTPLAQTAAHLGPHGLGAATVALCALPVFWQIKRGAPLAIAGFAALAGLGLWHQSTTPDLPKGAPVIRLSQPNAPQHQKWDPDFAPVFFRRGLAATRAEPRPDLIVWPETSLPNWLNTSAPVLDAISQAAGGTPVILGAQRYAGDEVFNSLAVLDAGGKIASIYDKHHLVPFGEYVPFAALLTRFGMGPMVDSASGFNAGAGPELLDLGSLGKALPMICYEAVFPDQMQASGGRADFMLHITNDAWFGTLSGPYQHLVQARFRAIEQGLPLVRSANTGISAAMDAHGEIIEQLPLGEAGYIDTVLPAPRALTFYARFGDIPTLAALIFLLCATLLPHRSLRD